MTFLFILLTLMTTCSSLWADTEIFGYFENRFFLLERRDIPWDNTNEKFKLGDYNRLRLKLQASPSDKVTVNVAVDFFSFHGIINSPLGTYENTPGAAPDEKNVTIDLDRAYVNLYFKKFDVTVGKQRVAMGVSYLWAPLDVFNRVNVFEPKEEKPGTNAVKVYVPLGGSSAITGVFAPDDDFKTSRSGLRAQTQWAGVDMALTLIRSGNENTSIYGLDLRGENFIGWWLEAAYVVSPGGKDKKIVVGFDYTFPLNTGLYWLSEYYYDESGEKDPANYDPSLLLTGTRFTMGRNYFFSSLRYSFSDFLHGSVAYIGNLDDGGFFINPNLQYDISDNIQISSGLYIPMGPNSSEFNSQDQNIFFLWLKVNF